MRELDRERADEIREAILQTDQKIVKAIEERRYFVAELAKHGAEEDSEAIAARYRQLSKSPMFAGIGNVVHAASVASFRDVPPEHFVVLSASPSLLVVKLNPRAYRVRRIQKSTAVVPVLSVNANYFWEGKPIGEFLGSSVDGETFPPSIASKGARPKVAINGDKTSVRCEVGPTLWKDGRPFNGMEEGEFRADVMRATRQTYIGKTRTGKVVLAFSEATNPFDAAETIALLVSKNNSTDPLHWLDKCDGGSSAHLRIKDVVLGAPKPVFGIGFF